MRLSIVETELLIEQFGCKILFLPAYSPELNPIEHTWASFKRYIKRFRHNFDYRNYRIYISEYKFMVWKYRNVTIKQFISMRTFDNFI